MEPDLPIDIKPINDPELGIIVSDETRAEVKRNYPDHEYQKPGREGHCGPASLQMLLKKSGFLITQEEITGTILPSGEVLFKPGIGTSHGNIKEFISIYFNSAGVEKDISIERLVELRKNGLEVMVNVMSEDDDGPGGHYIRVGEIDEDKKRIQIYDPSNGIRLDGKHGVYWLDYETFLREWWDYATESDERQNIKTEHWVAWIDPKSLKQSVLKSS